MTNLTLLAIEKRRSRTRLLHVSLSREAQQHLTAGWLAQYRRFIAGKEVMEFNAGYKLDANELFVATGFLLPDWLQHHMDDLPEALAELEPREITALNIRGLIGVVTESQDRELLLFQSVTPSRKLEPGQFLFLRGNTYDISKEPGFALDQQLNAVYCKTTMNLLFRSYRTVNAFLPLVDYYREASAEDIMSVLSHERLIAVDPGRVVERSNQWFNRRFAMLRDSDILDRYSAEEIASRGPDYQVQVVVRDDRIVFPEDMGEARRLLQLLNEERFLGPITQTLFETNSKRPAK